MKSAVFKNGPFLIHTMKKLADPVWEVPKSFDCKFVVAKEQDSDDEQIDKGITLKSKSIMQKTLYFLKKMK